MASMEQIRERNRAAGQHFFDADTLRFFRSRIGSKVYDGRFFVTSEQFVSGDYSADRAYTIREAKPDGRVETVGEFQQYATRAEAIRAIGRISAGRSCAWLETE